ncbi:MAG: hypothetical protein ACLTC3_04190 [Evtepia gabavorous]
MNGREAMGRLAQRVKASMGRYRLVWLVILAGLILLLLPTGERRERHGRKPSRRSRPSTWPRPRPACPRPCPRSTGRGGYGGAHRGQWTPADPGGECGPGRVPGEEKTETVVLSRGSGSQETVTVQEIYPRYQGALLVCAGGDDPTVRLQLTEAMSALTGLGADKISISQGK